jgi:uncharacterized protein YqhQ
MRRDPETELLVGGQALIEGVMMRSPGAYGIAVRRPGGDLAIRRGKVRALGRVYPLLRLPLLRGVAVLGQALVLGLDALNFSAAKAVETETGDAPQSEDEAKPGAAGDKLSPWALTLSLAGGLGLGIVLFLFLPLWLTQLGELYLYGPLTSLSFNLVDGLLRGLFFLVYVVAISRFPDIHRVFMYHGAEHKVVFNYESGNPLSVANARAESRLHPRCGTSFILFVLLVSIVLFSFIPRTSPFAVKFGGRLLLVPLVAGLSYELLRLSARRRSSPLFAAIVYPGLMLQRITTQEPTDDMLEVAIRALEEALAEDGLLPAEGPAVTEEPPLAAAAHG